MTVKVVAHDHHSEQKQYARVFACRFAGKKRCEKEEGLAADRRGEEEQ
jgi:hypothetical protein